MSQNPLPEEFLKKSKQERETIVNNDYNEYLINEGKSLKTFTNHRSAINYFLEFAGLSRIGQGTGRRPKDDTINNQYLRYLKRFNKWFESKDEVKIMDKQKQDSIHTLSLMGIKILKIQILFVLRRHPNIAQTDVVEELGIKGFDKNDFFTSYLLGSLSEQGYAKTEKDGKPKNCNITEKGKDFLDMFNDL